ncbi:P63C domain-containing protein [Achromobacter sp. GG226]|uniref:P63C domain-containing protein n=1 Tax=Verticiella alkaliphila TaxID=2779529 RepID=UPI001C0BD6C6|nr:P63C domain-containing protein [Verticiella sp. GG226]MBU4609173.1 P63C domain-containing protein [Verticiella sp. GG226]
MVTSKKSDGRAAGGAARAQKLTPERRSEIAKNAAAARKLIAATPMADYVGNLTLGSIDIPCAVLPDGTRLISQGGVTGAFGPVTGGWQLRRKMENEDSGGLPPFLVAASLNPFISEELRTMVTTPKMYRDPRGGPLRIGFEASSLPMICDVWLKAREAGALSKPQLAVAARAEILMRGLAHVGIIALVDEATGFQRDRERDALAKILESFVAKELQPYVKTFPPEYYEELFRLRRLDYPASNPRFRPQYFGMLTNDIVYERLAPGLLEELKRQASKDEKKAHLHRRLTQEIGHPKLREHLASVVTAMKLSDDYPDFISKLNRLHPRFGDTQSLGLEEEDR